MKTKIIFCALISSVLLTSCGNKSQNNQIKTRPTAEELMNVSRETFENHWKNGDAKALANEFTSDAIRVIDNPKGPLVGSESIQLSFAENNKEGSAQFKTHMETKVVQVKFVSDDILIGAGTWNILDEANKSVNNGKWGNVYKYKDGKIKFLMESAHATKKVTPANPDAINKNIFQTSLVLNDSNFNKIQSSVNRYVENVNSHNIEQISMEFTEDGIQAVSSSNDISIGRESIKSSLQKQPRDTNKLKANILGYKYLENSLAIAYGQWQNVDDKGTIKEAGQWGNIFKLNENKAILLMESAGRIQ